MDLGTLDLDKCYSVAVDLAKTAGDIIRNAIGKKKCVEMKTNPRDLVTETDKLVEELIKKNLWDIFPDHKFIGEESVSTGAKCELTDAPTWIIDPVDGTMNFVHSFPFTCISIGFWVNKVPEIGIVYNPNLEHMFTARKGKGAFLNGERIMVSGQKDLSQSLIFTEMGTRTDLKKMDILLRNFQKIVKNAHGARIEGSAALDLCSVAAGFADAYYHLGLHCWDMAAGALIVTEAGGVVMDISVRSMGSAALNMCFVAQGSIEAYYEIGIHAWDMAAGALIVREAGGYVCDVDGEEFDVLNRRVLCASSKEVADQLVGLLEFYDEERD